MRRLVLATDVRILLQVVQESQVLLATIELTKIVEFAKELVELAARADVAKQQEEQARLMVAQARQCAVEVFCQAVSIRTEVKRANEEEMTCWVRKKNEIETRIKRVTELEAELQREKEALSCAIQG